MTKRCRDQLDTIYLGTFLRACELQCERNSIQLSVLCEWWRFWFGPVCYQSAFQAKKRLNNFPKLSATPNSQLQSSDAFAIGDARLASVVSRTRALLCHKRLPPTKLKLIIRTIFTLRLRQWVLLLFRLPSTLFKARWEPLLGCDTGLGLVPQFMIRAVAFARFCHPLRFRKPIMQPHV